MLSTLVLIVHIITHSAQARWLVVKLYSTCSPGAKLISHVRTLQVPPSTITLAIKFSMFIVALKDKLVCG